MKEKSNEWSRAEFEAYLLIYCAHADFVKSEKEKALILEKVSAETYSKMNSEFEKDNDYQSIQKILNAAENFALSAEDITILLNEINAIFEADGKTSVEEHEIFIGLKRILK